MNQKYSTISFFHGKEYWPKYFGFICPLTFCQNLKFGQKKEENQIRETEIMERYVWLLSVTIGQKERSGKEINYYMGRAGTGDMAISENLSPFVSTL